MCQGNSGFLRNNPVLSYACHVSHRVAGSGRATCQYKWRLVYSEGRRVSKMDWFLIGPTAQRGLLVINLNPRR
jgi:hypothetical protein